MKRLINILLCFLMIFGMTGCAKADTKQMLPSETMVTTEQHSSETESVTTAPAQEHENTGDNGMQLLINNEAIPVTWENCTAVNELSAETENGDIIVHMSMYGGWEQVGSLGRSYTRDDRQMTAVNGDIVLYSGNQIVVFYGSNSWSYTKLGKMGLSAEEVTELLSNGDITLTITK